jgi:hypothetical protein
MDIGQRNWQKCNGVYVKKNKKYKEWHSATKSLNIFSFYCILRILQILSAAICVDETIFRKPSVIMKMIVKTLGDFQVILVANQGMA